MRNNITEIPKIDYIGKIVIEANNPKKLADWYTNKFGLNVNLEISGEFHTTVSNNNMRLYIEIIPNKEKLKNKSNIELNFHVTNFKEYLHNLKLKHIVPYKTLFNYEGEYAYFKDPENNKIAIQGTLN